MKTFPFKAAALCLAIIFAFQPIFGQTAFVSPGGVGDGSSWANANGDLKAVLDAASFGDVIWVQQGTYYPETCINCTPTDKNQSFEINDGVSLYGGFQGSESSLAQRDWEANLTILSGDLNQDNQSDSNAYTVVYFENVSSSTILDGFTIKDGNANSPTGSNSNRERSGGGIYNEGSISSNPLIKNSIVQNNRSVAGGGGMVNNGSSGGQANPRIENCQFLNNECGQNGGAIFNDASGLGVSSPEIIHVVFQDNLGKYGAGVYNSALTGTSSPTIRSCSFLSNTATAYSGAIYNFGKSGGTASPLIFNCLFYKNTASSAGAVYSLGSEGTATPQIVNCTFFGNHADTGGAVYCNESVGGETQATITNSILWNNTAGFDPIFHLSGAGAPKIILNHSLINAASCDDIIQFQGPLDTVICEGGMIYNQYPMFVDTINLNFRLDNFSPAINQGDNDIVNSNGVLYDLDNHIRIHNGQVDMGIYEYGSQPYQPPVIAAQPISQTVCEYEDPVLSITAEGTEPFDFQWSKNGIEISGATDDEYTISDAVSGDIGDYSCRVISIFADTVYSNLASLGVNILVDPDIEIEASSTNICEGNTVTFNTTVVNEGTNPAYEWKINGQVVFTGSDTFTYSDLEDGDEVNCRLTSSELCASPSTITSSSITIDVDPVVAPAISINASVTQICSGESVTFNAAQTNGGANPFYSWTVDGQVVGTDSPSFSSSSLADGATVVCQLSSSFSCANPATVLSNGIEIEVGTLLQPAISVTANTTQICEGETINFSTSSVNTGGNPIYQWTVDGMSVGTNSPNFSSNSLADAAVVACLLTSSASCASPSTVTSNSIDIEVTSLVEPTINISASALEICSGESVTFTATTSNAGANPMYEWFIDGQSVGANSTIFTSSNLTNGVVVTCALSSSMLCASPGLVVSNIVSPTVITTVQPTISVTASTLEACSGETITFTANTTNEGQNPVYQWMVNNQPVGGNSPTFSSATLLDDSEVYCEITSSAACATPATASSSLVEIQITYTVQPAVQVSANASQICAGELVTFTAVEVNGGSNPIFEWWVNGVISGTNSAVFSTTTLADGSSVFCEMTSSALCTTQPEVTSNTIALEVADVIEPEIEISSSASAFCIGDTAVFTANAVNGGTAPSYEWHVNGQVVPENGSVFSSAGLVDGALVECQLISSSNCASPVVALSNTLEVNIINTVNPAISINTDFIEICSGELITFQTSTMFGGVSPSYDWLVNGVSTGINDTIFYSDFLNDQDTIICIMTSSESCASSSVVNSEPIVITVNPGLILDIELEASETTICLGDTVTFIANSENQGSSPIYQWMVNESFVNGNGNEFISADLMNGDSVSCVLVSSEFCVSNNNIQATPIVMAVDSCLLSAFNTFSSESKMSIYPNPTSGTFTIKYEGTGEFFEMLIQDVQGRVMKKERINIFGSSLAVDISSLSAGLYFIKIIGLHNSYNFKVILEN